MARPGRRPGGQRARLLRLPGRDADDLGRCRARPCSACEGEVDLDDWRALFGTGGPHHPDSGERLVHCMRPGMELVVSPRKSVAELGVIGRAEDMHAIVDAETRRHHGVPGRGRRASRAGGGAGRRCARRPAGSPGPCPAMRRPGRAIPSPTTMSWLANVVKMGDERGGWKALDTALFRDHLHAATAIGRMAAAAKAVELGYGIEPDPGPSGRLGGLGHRRHPPGSLGGPRHPLGPDRRRRRPRRLLPGPRRSPPGPPGTTRCTKASRTCCPAGGTSWPGPATRRPELSQSVERAGLGLRAAQALPSWTRWQHELLGPGGRLASEKTFARRDVVVAVAPYLHGLPVSYLDKAVDKVLSHELADRPAHWWPAPGSRCLPLPA